MALHKNFIKIIRAKQTIFIILISISFISCNKNLLSPHTNYKNSSYLSGDYIDLSKVSLKDLTNKMNEYLNGNPYNMLCFKGNIDSNKLKIIKDYIKGSDRLIYLDLKNCTNWDNNSNNDYTFSGLSNLSGIKLTHDCYQSKVYMFKDCINITNIVFPDSMSNFQVNTFENTPKLKYLKIPDTVSVCGIMCFYDTYIETLVFGNNMRILGDNALQKCTNLKTLVINEVFERFAKSALSQCSNLTEIVYYGTINRKIEFDRDVFYRCPTNELILYLPNIERHELDNFSWPKEYYKYAYCKGEFDINEILR